MHPTLSLFVYRFNGTGTQHVTLIPDWPEPDACFEPESFTPAPPASGVRRDGDVLFIKARSNIYCPAIIAAACDGGRIDGTTVTCPPGSVLYLAYGHQSIGNPETLAEQILRSARARGADALHDDLTAWWRDRWRALAGKVDLSILRDPEIGYLYAAGQREFKSKVGAALIVTHFPTGAEHDVDGVLRTYRRIRRDEVFGGCGFDRSFQAIALTHVGAAREALESLAGQVDPRGELIDPACITFRESDRSWITGGLRGRMPYFHTSHGFFAYAIQQMLLQDYTGETKIFPACPWPEAEFALWSDGRLIEGHHTEGLLPYLPDGRAISRGKP